jgi:hypothetical protein
MRGLLVVVVALVLAPAAGAELAPTQPLGNTEARLIHYVAHDGVRRTAWLLLPWKDVPRLPEPVRSERSQPV